MLLRKLAISLFLVFSLNVSADVQDDRKGFIQKLIGMNVFQKVEIPGSLPHLWVKPSFNSLSFDEKNSFVNVVYSYYYTLDSSYSIVVLYDSLSGKKIGTFSASYGGLDLK